MIAVRGRTGLQAALGRPPRQAAVAVGNFDGVHRGHQSLLAAARQAAGKDGDVIALTFDPHPARLFAPALTPPFIVSLPRRLELLAEAGATVVVAEPFTAQFASIEAESFVADVLARDLGARHVVVGYDFSFGKGRRGNTSLMEQLSAAAGLGLTVVGRVSVHGITCSSTRIREFILDGQVEGAEVLLGRPCELTGQVVRGAARGRLLGYPTANLRVDGVLIPKPGIYAARAKLLPSASAPAPSSAGWACAVSIGTNPTFATGAALTVEAHLLDFSGDLYDRELRLELVQRLRDEQRFDSVEALVAQIAADVERTRVLTG